MKKPTLLFAVTSTWFSKLFSQQDLKRIYNCTNVVEAPQVVEPDAPFLNRYATDADVVISSWGTEVMPKELLGNDKRLRLLCHAGGSVKHLATPELWASGAQLVSAAPAIGAGVAEYCLGMMIVAGKRIFHTSRATRSGGWREEIDCFGGNLEFHQQKVGVIGASMVGKQLLRLLQNFSCEVYVYDPYCSEETVREFGAVKVDTLDELFSSCRFISINAPTTPETTGMLRGSHFRQLQDGSVFINSARSILVNEPEFIAELEKGRFIACIDVTSPEPCPVDHPYRTLPNVILTPHLAGGASDNLLRIGTLVADEVERFAAGEPLQYSLTAEQLRVMA